MVLATFALVLRWPVVDPGLAVTTSFLTLAFSRLLHVFNMRDVDSGLIANEITRNPYIWGALALCTGLLLLAVYVPGLAAILNMADPGVKGWLVIIPASLTPLALIQILKLFGLKWA